VRSRDRLLLTEKRAQSSGRLNTCNEISKASTRKSRNILQERTFDKGIRAHLNASRITKDLQQKAHENCTAKAPYLVSDCYGNLGNEGQAEDHCVQEVAAEVGKVIDMSQGKGTDLQGAQSVTVVGDCQVEADGEGRENRHDW
jgi:hypothetical protein